MRDDGYTLAEALTALLVAGVLVLCLAAILGMVGRAAIRHAEAAAASETERTVAAILGAELRALTAADATFGADSVRLRAFRGGGPVCARDGTGVVIEYQGVRQPEADKDSVLLLWDEGEAAYDLASSLAGSCGDGAGMRLLLDTAALPSAGPLFGLVFETGAYSIAGAALRYRRGAAGRQPLTQENLAGGSGLMADTAGAAAIARVRLRSTGSGNAPPHDWALRMPQGALRAPGYAP